MALTAGVFPWPKIFPVVANVAGDAAVKLAPENKLLEVAVLLLAVAPLAPGARMLAFEPNTALETVLAVPDVEPLPVLEKSGMAFAVACGPNTVGAVLLGGAKVTVAVPLEIPEDAPKIAWLPVVVEPKIDGAAVEFANWPGVLPVDAGAPKPVVALMDFSAVNGETAATELPVDAFAAVGAVLPKEKVTFPSLADAGFAPRKANVEIVDEAKLGGEVVLPIEPIEPNPTTVVAIVATGLLTCTPVPLALFVVEEPNANTVPDFGLVAVSLTVLPNVNIGAEPAPLFAALVAPAALPLVAIALNNASSLLVGAADTAAFSLVPPRSEDGKLPLANFDLDETMLAACDASGFALPSFPSLLPFAAVPLTPVDMVEGMVEGIDVAVATFPKILTLVETAGTEEGLPLAEAASNVNAKVSRVDEPFAIEVVNGDLPK